MNSFTKIFMSSCPPARLTVAAEVRKGKTESPLPLPDAEVGLDPEGVVVAAVGVRDSSR